MRTRSPIFTFLAFAFAFFSAASVNAASVRPKDLDAVINGAAIVFQGRAIESRSVLESSGEIVTYTTFQVEERIKGPVGVTHTIKQIGGRVGERVFKVDGIPSFATGQRYVIFLYGVSAQGFSSPVGLEQGRFDIVTRDGVSEVGNGRDFRELLAPIPEAVLPPSVRAKLQAKSSSVERLELGEFKRLVRERVGR